MWFIRVFWLVVFSLAFATSEAFAQDSAAPNDCSVEITLDGAIGSASLDLLDRGLKRTKEYRCKSMLILINTPGGSLQTTRMIVERILASPVPIMCLVYPSGGHAGSAGAIILQACHVAGAMEATNIGAATPVASTGQEIPKDLRQKLLNDSKSWLDGITELRERSKKFGRDIITEAKAVSAREALKLGAIDFVAQKKSEFLDFAKGRSVKMSEGRIAEVDVGEVITFVPDYRHKIVTMLTDPQTAYMMFMGSLGLLYFEMTHPGMIVPGVIGAIGLVVSLVSLHKLDVATGGLALLFLGIAFMIGEAFLPSFGFLGIGGVISFFLGSVFLFDPSESEHSIPMSLIFSTTLVLGACTLVVAYMAFNSRKARRRGNFNDIEGSSGEVMKVGVNQKEGSMQIEGEIWKFKSEDPVQVGDQVMVTSHKGLTLFVKKGSQ